MRPVRDTGVCELAALYSLGALDGDDAWAYRAHLLDGCGACSGALEGFEEVVGELGRAADPASPSPILRERLLDAVAEPGAPRPLASVAGDEAEWESHSIPGVSVRRLHVDERARETVLLVRAAPGVRYPSHRHAAVEEMFMLEGELRFGDTTYRAGDYIRSEGGSVHGSSETAGGCMFLLRASLDNELRV